MRVAILRAKPRERSIAIVAFLVLLFVIGAHALLETARDALFLAKIPASQLPWLYILIAIASLLVTQLGARLRVENARALTLIVAATALVTFCLGWVVPRFPIVGAYVLYVWTGVLIAVVLMRFWDLVGGLFTVAQAKLLYGFVGTGSVVGAIAGSGAARALAEVLPATQLVFAGGVSLGVGALVTTLFWREGEVAAQVEDASAQSQRECVRYVFRHPYARKVALLVALGAMALTVVDYLFKSIVAARVPPEDLGTFFATVYLALNVGSLAVQLLVVGWAIRRFNTLGALSLLPSLVLVGSVGLVALPASAGLAVALAMKGVDGVMRHTLNRTATELLFVPLSPLARGHLKLFADVASQKGGQALISIAILGLGVVGGAFALPGLLVGLVALWLVVLFSTRGSYLALVRSQLRRGTRPEGLPDLDVEALEALVRALDSTDESEVREAMMMLSEEGKADLIPTLILHHPSDEVAVDALGHFARSQRTSALDVVRKISEQRSCEVRSAALRTAHALGAELDFGAIYAGNESWFVKATAVCALATKRVLSVEEHSQLHETTINSDPLLLVSLARDIAMFNAEALAPYLEALCNHDVERVRQAALGAVDVERFKSHDRLLLGALADERTRNLARELVRNAGVKTASLIIDSLADASIDKGVRLHLPATVARLPDTERAANALITQLRREKQGMVRYWILRSLDWLLNRHPQVEPDLRWVESELAENVTRAYRYLSRAEVLSGHADVVGEMPGHQMLVRLLRDKQKQSVGRVFLLLDIGSRRENFMSIWNSLRGKDVQMRDAALEMVDNVLQEPLRSAVRGLVGDFSEAERLVIGERYHKHEHRSYLDVLAELDASQSQSARELTTCHRDELEEVGADTLSQLGEVASAA